jgi:predicted Zn-dependent protease with MMP-like domain
MTAVLTNHARLEMVRRGIAEDLVMAILERPEQVVAEREGLVAYQSRLGMEDGRVMLVRGIAEDRSTPRKVITVYRTSKIDKYWRQP